MATPQLSLSNTQAPQCFSQKTEDSIESLASSINNQSSQESLDSILDAIIQELFLYSSAQRAQIDNYVSVLSSIANRIDQPISHPGDGIEGEYRSTVLRPSGGPYILVERLSHSLYKSIWDYTSLACTPDGKDGWLPKSYYRNALVQVTILARGFVTQPGFRDNLWREIEDVFVKGLFSGPQQEPAVFVILAALFLGAGAEIREYMSQKGKGGQGGKWLWYSDKRASSEKWQWKEVVKALRKEPGPSPTTENSVGVCLNLAKNYIGDGEGELNSWSSEKLATEAFTWVDT